ncbi:MAG: CoA transferase [Pseudomonadota bacterium]
MNVLELGGGVAASYAAKLLADQGADVIKVEDPAGDRTRHRGPYPDDTPHPEKSGLFLPLNVQKRSVVTENLEPLLAWADVLVYSYRAEKARTLGLDAESLAAAHPDLLVLSITPFGAVGPYAEFAAEELIVTNAGGWAGLCPATRTEPEFPPLKVFGYQCAMMAGTAGALAITATLRDVRRTGVGEFIDLSEQEYVASVLEAGIPVYSYREEIPSRNGLRALIPWRIFQAKDAPVFLVCVEQDQWERLVAFMGNPDWATIDLLQAQPDRAENQDIVHQFLQDFVSEWTADELYHAAQKHNICVAPVMTVAQMADNKHLRARHFFTTLEHPLAGEVEYIAPAVITQQGRAVVSRRAPLLGEHTDEVLSATLSARTTTAEKQSPRRPLEGIRVLDLTWVWAGAFGAMNLAHLGADVIKVESSHRPDLYRRLPIVQEEFVENPGLNHSGMFNQWNQGKRSVSINLSSPEGIELVKQLVAECDVVTQNFATGVMERIGLGYSVLKSIKSDIILASISGYGQSGPLAHYMGYGPAMPPLTGLSHATGYIGEGPEELGLSMPDPTAGITAALAVVEALNRRDETGEGDQLDISLWEATGVMAAEAWMYHAMNGETPERIGNRDPHMAPHGVFACAGEDEWMAIACSDDEAWQRMAALVAPELAHDTRFKTLAARKANEDALEARITEWTCGQDRWALTRALQAANVAAFPTLTCQDIVHDEHLNTRGFIERLPHPEVGVRAHAGIPWRMHQRPNGVAKAAPCLGEDTVTVLRDLLGVDAAALPPHTLE